MFPICTYVIQDIFCVCLGSLEDPNVRHAERVTIKKGLMTQYAKPVVKVNMKIYCKKYGCRCRHMSIIIFDGVYVKILLPSLPGLGECCSMSEVCVRAACTFIRPHSCQQPTSC